MQNNFGSFSILRQNQTNPKENQARFFSLEEKTSVQGYVEDPVEDQQSILTI